ncbi:MAG: M14-type cytosolic carboxypeptidase [Kiritimatiellae bacterium]|jgi:hypothetical protein|nr:M14-type cytosolic carboxypeptidase [Kiritimatiellia bacterium]
MKIKVYLVALIALSTLSAIADLSYIDTSFSNASPLYWEQGEDDSIQIYLVYDQERDSVNRANGHWHFRVEGTPGSKLHLVLNNLRNIWNGHPGIPVSKKTICNVSDDGHTWRTIQTELIGEQLHMDVTLKTQQLYVAHMEPYTLSDLEKLLNEIHGNPLVEISNIGKTVQGRPLEIIRVGKADAPHRILIRARAHPWEPGGNWVVQGLIRSLLTDDPANKRYLDRYAVYILPMANKDGVAAGRTRFNLAGMDLNRKWDKPADPELAPENAAFESWMHGLITEGKKPDLAFDLHNDQSGLLHLSRPKVNLEQYLADMNRYETLMRKYTWFTEGHTGGSFHNPGSFGEGLLERFGITAFIQELNANWIEGLKENTSAKNWELLGAQYRDVFYEYFTSIP